MIWHFYAGPVHGGARGAQRRVDEVRDPVLGRPRRLRLQRPDLLLQQTRRSFRRTLRAGLRVPQGDQSGSSSKQHKF